MEQYVLQWRLEAAGSGAWWHELRVTGSSADVAVMMQALEKLGNEVTCAVDAPAFPEYVPVEPVAIVE